MDDIFVPCLVPPSLATEEGSGLSPSSVLLDNTAYISAVAVSNATTAVAETSAGTPIHVSFCLAPHPPRLSYMCVHFPGPAAPLSAAIPDGAPAARCVKQAPRVISTHAGLVLLRVPQPGAIDITNPRYRDYFVYTASPGPGTASLHRIRQPLDAAADFAIFRCSGGTYRYIIAGLGNTTDREKFRLQLYDSDTGRWTSTLLSVDAPQRDTVLPIPSTATELGFHYTSKVITLGGPRATIGWVDLWRGILLCDVLDDKPVLRDVPLPKPSKGNRPYFCRGSPHRYREIDVVTLPGPGQQHIEIKYIEMETRPGEDLPPPRRSVVDNSDSDDDESDKDLVVAPYWKATIWTMPVPVGSWKDWRKDRDSRVDVTDIAIDDPRHCEVLLRLPRLTTDQESAAMSLRRLITAYPTLELGVDGDLVIYLSSKVDFMDREGWVIAVGARDKKLRGIAELDSRKNDFFGRYYLHTDISKFPTEATDKLTVLSWTITIGHIQISDQGYRCVRSPRGKEKVVVNDEACWAVEEL